MSGSVQRRCCCTGSCCNPPKNTLRLRTFSTASANACCQQLWNNPSNPDGTGALIIDTTYQRSYVEGVNRVCEYSRTLTRPSTGCGSGRITIVAKVIIPPAPNEGFWRIEYTGTTDGNVADFTNSSASHAVVPFCTNAASPGGFIFTGCPVGVASVSVF